MKIIKSTEKTGLTTSAVCHGCQGEYPITTGRKEWRLHLIVHDGHRLRTLVYCQRCAWVLQEMLKVRTDARDLAEGRFRWRLIPNQLRNRWLEYMDDVRETADEGNLDDAIPIVHEVDAKGRQTGICRTMTERELEAFKKRHSGVRLAEEA